MASSTKCTTRIIPRNAAAVLSCKQITVDTNSVRVYNKNSAEELHLQCSWNLKSGQTFRCLFQTSRASAVHMGTPLRRKCCHFDCPVQWVTTISFWQNGNISVLLPNVVITVPRDHSGYGLSRWDTTLQCNVGSHRLSPQQKNPCRPRRWFCNKRC